MAGKSANWRAPKAPKKTAAEQARINAIIRRNYEQAKARMLARKRWRERTAALNRAPSRATASESAASPVDVSSMKRIVTAEELRKERERKEAERKLAEAKAEIERRRQKWADKNKEENKRKEQEKQIEKGRRRYLKQMNAHRATKGLPPIPYSQLGGIIRHPQYNSDGYQISAASYGPTYVPNFVPYEERMRLKKLAEQRRAQNNRRASSSRASSSRASSSPRSSSSSSSSSSYARQPQSTTGGVIRGNFAAPKPKPIARSVWRSGNTRSGSASSAAAMKKKPRIGATTRRAPPRVMTRKPTSGGRGGGRVRTTKTGGRTASKRIRPPRPASASTRERKSISTLARSVLAARRSKTAATSMRKRAPTKHKRTPATRKSTYRRTTAKRKTTRKRTTAKRKTTRRAPARFGRRHTSFI